MGVALAAAGCGGDDDAHVVLGSLAQALLGLQHGQVLPGTDYHLGNPDLTRFAQGFAQEDIAFFTLVYRRKVIWLIEIDIIDGILVHEPLKLHGLGRFRLDFLEILIVQQHILAAVILISLYNLILFKNPGSLPWMAWGVIFLP